MVLMRNSTTRVNVRLPRRLPMRRAFGQRFFAVPSQGARQSTKVWSGAAPAGGRPGCGPLLLYGFGGKQAMSVPSTASWSPPRRRRVYLVRHGDVSYFDAQGRPVRPGTVPLNAEGRRQAEAGARELAGVPLDRVVVSDLRRKI